MNWKVHIRHEKIEPGVQLDFVTNAYEPGRSAAMLSRDDSLEIELPNNDCMKGVVVEVGAKAEVIVEVQGQRWRTRPLTNEDTLIRPPIEGTANSWIVVTMLAPN